MFGSVKLTKNADPGKYKYSGHGIGLDLRAEFLLPDVSMGKNAIIFGVNMSSSVHIVNKIKDVILGKGPTQGLDNTMLTAEVFSVDYNIIDASNINIHKYLMKKHDIN